MKKLIVSSLALSLLLVGCNNDEKNKQIVNQLNLVKH